MMTHHLVVRHHLVIRQHLVVRHHLVVSHHVVVSHHLVVRTVNCEDRNDMPQNAPPTLYVSSVPHNNCQIAEYERKLHKKQLIARSTKQRWFIISNNLAHDGSWASFGRTSWANVVSIQETLQYELFLVLLGSLCMVLGVRQMKICVTQIKRNSDKTSNPIDERLLGGGVPDQKFPHKSVQRLLAIIFYILWKSKCNVFAWLTLPDNS